MCGIIITKRENGSDEIIDSISHRGIEKTKTQAGGFNLCHHRLPIQTRDGDSWNQPKEVSPGIFLLFNGEIFNYNRDLYGSDIEYLISLFSTYSGSGVEMFTALYLPHILTWDGFWAIILFNSKSGEIICFTDPLGKKCLYVNNEGEVCSEIKGLVRKDYSLDKTYISSVRKWGYNKDNRTPYNEIKRILPNVIYSFNVSNPSFFKTFPNYFSNLYSPIPELIGKDYEEHMNWLWDKMVESVTNRLISKDYPISVLISGGLDSSIIAAILKAETDAKINWFSIENDETEYVNILANHLDIKVKMLSYEMDESLNSEIYSKWNETPVDLGSVIPQYYLFKAVKDQTGQRIVISGDGSDELFGGYSRILEYDSQGSDVFEELSFYHLPRLDKMSMAHTLELRSPFLNLDIVRFALNLPKEWRTEKKILKDTFRSLMPDLIVDRKKVPLKNPQIREDKIAYRQKAIDLFTSSFYK
jgi:asparagine synthase (glutamine-hydrolysing)